MKKFFKNIGKKSPAKGPPPSGSPKPGRGAQAAGPSSVEIGYDVREKDLGKLHKAAWTSDINKVHQLAKKDPSPVDKENRTPLHLACARGHAAVVQELLEWKAKTNIVDNESKTPLMKAVECQHVDCVGLLLEHRAQVEAMDNHGNTCLHRAIKDGQYDIAVLLLRAGASPNAKNKIGESVLHTAVKDNNEGLCQLLLKANADANIIDSEYRIPLMYACQDGLINIVKLLLEFHADTTYKEDKGWTADDYAVIKGHHACSTLIADHDRKYNRGSGASTPRTGSFPPSVSATPRDTVVNDSLGLPAQDAAGDDSGDETVSRASGHGAAGGDSWGDDTDISIAADDKAKEAVSDNEDDLFDDDHNKPESGKQKINLSKLVRNMSESEKEESVHSNINTRESLDHQNSIISNDSWAAADSPTTPRRVSFKKDGELSEIRNISFQEEQRMNEVTRDTTVDMAYTPTGVAASTPKVPLTADKQRAGEDKKSEFLEDLGLSDVDDISEFSEMSAADPNKLKSSGAESDWDSTLPSEQQLTPRPGILKKWKQEAINNTPAVKAALADEDSEWDSEVDDAAMPGTGNITTQSDSLISDLDSSETVPIPCLEDSTHQDKESTIEVVTPRPPSEQLQESDWDSTVEAVTPRQNSGLSYKQVGIGDDIDEEENDDVSVPPLLSSPPPSSPPTKMFSSSPPTRLPADIPTSLSKPEEDEISAWDSDDGDLPSETIPPPAGFSEDFDFVDNIQQLSPTKTNITIEENVSLEQSPKTSPQKTTPTKDFTLQTSPVKQPSPRINPTPPLSPRKSPRIQRDPSDSDEDAGESETISEWEIEHKKQKLLVPSADNIADNITLADNIADNITLADNITDDLEISRQLEWEQDIRRSQDRIQREAEEAIEAERRELEDQLSEDEQEKKEDDDEFSFHEPTISLDDIDEPARIEANNNTKTDIINKDIQKHQQQTSLNTAPPPVLSMKEPQFSTHRELQQRLQIPGVYTNLPINTTTTQFIAPSPLDDDDDSYASDNPDLPLDRPDATAVHYPGLISPGHFYNLETTPDDDVLSYTSTEFDGDNSLAQPVIGKDLLMNLSANDPTTILRIQEHVRQTQKSFEQERNQRLILDNKYRLLAKEKNDLQKKIDEINTKKSELEQNKLNLDAKIRSLEYGLTEEQEKRKNAEILLGKTKDQLVRKEEQYNSELEAKQKSELELRNIQTELRAANHKVKELEDDVKEVERQFQHEKNQRLLQEQINEEQQKSELQRQDSIRSAHHQAIKRSNSGELDENAVELETLRAELYALQMELDRQRSRLKDESSLLSSENEELQQRVEELRSSIKLHEESMVHLTMQHNVTISNLKTDISVISSNLEKEKSGREKSEAELGSVSTRLAATINEMENATHARNELERTLQQEKETLGSKLEKKDEELSSLKLNNNQLSQRINNMEDKLHQMESELNVSNTSLMERTNQLQQYRQDIDKNKSFNGESDLQFRLEKEQNSKLQMKIENLQEKLNQAMHESLNFKQQLELVRQHSSQENSASSAERMNTTINTLRVESDKARAALEDKNTTLNEAVTRLREELRNSDNRRSTIEQDLRKLTQDHTDLIKNLSSAEANLSVAVKTKEHLEHEKNQLQLEIQRLQQRYEAAHEKTLESQARISELVERTERAEQNSLLSSQKLANTSANMEAKDKSKDDIREELQKLQVSYARIESELKHEKQRADMLQEDLLDTQKVRASLEALCANLKSTSGHLEEKLNYDINNDDYIDTPLDEETANRTAFEIESQESKGLWEQEIVSRSKLGLRLAQLQRQNQDSTGQLDEEKRKLRKVVEVKKTLESKYDEEKSRNNELEKEVTQLKAHLKASRKRLKDTDFNDSRISSLQSEFDKERIQLDAALSTAKRQLEDCQSQLQSETEEKDQLRHKNRELKEELSKIEHSETNKYSSVKTIENGGDCEQGLIDQIRKELETKYRMELNRKLDEVNLYLEEQSRARDKLDRSRGDNDTKLIVEKKRLDDENTNLRLKYEQALSTKESKEIESRRYRDLYESEMRWRMRLSDQLQETTDKSLNLKSRIATDKHRSKLQATFGNLNFSAVSSFNEGSRMTDDILSNKLRAELDRSIAKHLEAAPHDSTIPVIRSTDESINNSSFAKSSADYHRILQRKYCV